MKKNITIILLLFGVLLNVTARKTIVTSATSINNGNWVAGDTLILKNGIWTNQVISLRAFGTDTSPIVLVPETAGSVVFNGSSRMSISGKYIEISGLYFKDGSLSGSPVIEFRTSSSNHAENCRLTNCAILNYNPELNTVDSKWVSLYGKNNKVDNCTFENKTNSGTLLVVWLNEGIIPAHIINKNYFGYRNSNLDENGNELNGQEIIRIGDSNTSMQYANCVVRDNYFNKCNGEIEVISNKSCGNIYSNNVFVECKGMLTLRHGNDCTVEGNYFFGNGEPSTGGVRIIGENHKVYNNYFDNLRGTNFRSAICLVRGKENSVLNDYFQVKNALVVFNTFVNCSQSFCINYNSSSSYTMPPITTTIAHNHVYNTNSNNTNVNLAKSQSDLDITWKNNLMNKGKYTNISFSSTEVISGKNPYMQIASTPIPLNEPAPGSELTNYSTNEYSNINKDIRGRNRDSNAKIPGASEITGVTNTDMPDINDIGASFLIDFTSVNNPCIFENELNVFTDNGIVKLRSKVNGELNIYNLFGIKVYSQFMDANVLYEKKIACEALILRFINDDGFVSTNKLIL